ncbi:MAG: hypothetical protein ABI488_04825 [Polyangiaceae bacterium]
MKSISWLACVAAASALCVSVSCSSSDKKTADGSSGSGADAGTGAGASSGKGNGPGGAPGAGEGGTANTEGGAVDEPGGTTGTDAAGSGGGSTLPTAPKPILCPESDPIHPKLPNSVDVQGVTLTADTHWTSDKIYMIQDDFKVEGHTLTIDAGTVICMTHQAKIYVGEGVDPGEIHINGTADKHVVITAFPTTDDATKVDAFHGGIKFDTYEGSNVSYLDVWYGGPGGGGASYAIELDDTAQGNGSDKTVPLLLDHVTVGAVQSKGFRVGTPNGIAANSKITFTGFAAHTDSDPDFDTVTELNWYAEKSVANALTMYTDNIPAAAKRARLITAVPPLYLEHDAEITDIGLPYYYKDGSLIISGVDDDHPATLTIDAGITIHMGKQLQVGDKHEGDLVIAGTADKPVTLTSAEDVPGPGDWEGIYFVGNFYSPTKSKVSYLNLDYAGLDLINTSGLHVGRCGDDVGGAIQVSSPGAVMWDGPSITHTAVSHSQTWGIATDSGSLSGAINDDYTAAALGNTFTDCAQGKVTTPVCTP